jgi:hypothetical protein
MEVYWLGIVAAPTGHPKNGAYDVTDVGIIDDDSDVPANADGPIKQMRRIMIVIMTMTMNDGTNSGDTIRNSNRR